MTFLVALTTPCPKSSAYTCCKTQLVVVLIISNLQQQIDTIVFLDADEAIDQQYGQMTENSIRKGIQYFDSDLKRWLYGRQAICIIN